MYGGTFWGFFWAKEHITFRGLVLWKNIKFFSSFPDFERKHPGYLGKEFQPNCKEWVRRARETFWRVFLEKRTKKLLQFPNFEQKIFGLSANFSSRIIKIEFNVSTRVFWGFFEKLYSLHHFCTWSKQNESSFGGKLSVGWSNCYNHRTYWGKTFLLAKLWIITSISRFSAKFFRNFDQNTSTGLSEL